MTQPELTRLLREIGATAPLPPDYAAQVRASVALGTRRRGLAAAGGLAAVLLLAGGAVALSTQGGDTVAVATPSPTASATPAATLSPVPLPVTTVTFTPEPLAPTPAPSGVTAAPTRTPVVSPAPVTAAPSASPVRSPAGTFVGPGLAVSLDGPSTAVAGRPAQFTASLSDTDGLVLSAVIDWGDGSSTTLPGGATCGRSSGTTPEPLERTVGATHTYAFAGSGYTAVLTVRTGSSCRATPRETRSAVQTTPVVDPAPTTPPPS